MYEPNNGKKAPQQTLNSLNIDYRHFDANDIDPIYEFGFGLSYTTFEYGGLRVTPLNAAPYVPSSGLTRPAPVFGNTTKAGGNYVSTRCPHRLRYLPEKI